MEPNWSKIKEYLREKGYSLREYAEHIGIAQSTVSMYLNGTKKMSWNFLQHIVADFPDFDWNALFTQNNMLNEDGAPYNKSSDDIIKDLEHKLTELRRRLEEERKER